MKKYKFKNLDNIQNFVLRVLQLMIDTIHTDFNVAIKRIETYIGSWNSKYCNNFMNPQCGIKGFSKDVSGDVCKFGVNIFYKNTDFILNIYYSKDNWRPLYSIQLFDSDRLLVAQFTEESLNNPRYLNSLPTLEQEVAYDIYATYYNYVHNESEIYKSQLEAYPKYVEKNFKDSDLLSKILSLLKDKETDKRKILIFIKALCNKIMNELEKYTTEQLKAELKRRAEIAKAEHDKIARCKNCANMIIVDSIYGVKFTKCKVNTYKLYGKNRCKVVKPSSKACEKYEKAE